MIGLFWRIFFSFWAAMLLLLAVMAYSTFTVVNAWNEQGQLSYDELIGRADVVLKDGGEDRLRGWLRNPSNFPPDLTLFVFDPAGDEILRRDIPPPVETTLTSADPQARLPRYRPRQLVSGSGVEYLAVLGPNAPPILGALGTPLMRWTVIVAAFVISPLVCFVLSRSLTNPLRQVVLNTHSPEVARQLPFDDLVFVERALTSQDGPISSFRPITGTWRATAANGPESTAQPIDRRAVADFIGGSPVNDELGQLKLEFGSVK